MLALVPFGKLERPPSNVVFSAAGKGRGREGVNTVPLIEETIIRFFAPQNPNYYLASTAEGEIYASRN